MATSRPATSCWAAIKTVIVADFVMSVDNVIGIAGARRVGHDGHQMSLVIFGSAGQHSHHRVGQPTGHQMMDRFPIIITAGGMLLGWIAGTLAVGDPLLAPWLGTSERWLGWAAGAGGALLVWVLGLWFQRRALAAKVAG
jgi:predicted tellurium resistance membrane protein TerC